MGRSSTQASVAPPVMEARRWLDGAVFTADRPLINVSQAAPVDPPPTVMREAMAEALLHRPETHLYGPCLGHPDLRAAIAQKTKDIYGATTLPEQVAVTAGCNQAFTAVISAIAAQGDEIILPVPWYFNHKMWLDMAGITTIPLYTGDDLLPDPKAAQALITAKTRAIVLVTPNNPSGVEYSPALIAAFRDVARDAGIKLIIDETYRDFHSQSAAPHALFQDEAWADTLVQLYSFSKSYRLTGHRVGAVIASPDVISEAEKFLDTVTICASQIGQFAALWGMTHLGDWLAGERLEILARADAIRTNMPRLERHGWRLKGCGAYFAYMQHPFAAASDEVAQNLVRGAGVLCLPGTMFAPENDPTSARHLRIAFANLDAAGISQLFDRLETLSYPLAPPTEQG